MNKSFGISDFLGAFLSLFCLASMYVFPGITRECCAKALTVCGRSVIPSLFPYIVLSRIFVHYLEGVIQKRHDSGKMGKIPFIKHIALVCGLLSGFPAGAVISGQLYSKNIITRRDAERTALFSSVASPAFCINFFGYEIMKSRKAGLIIYIASVMVSIMLMYVSGKLFENNNDSGNHYRRSLHERKSESVSEIIYDSCMTIINICAYVTFFMCAGEILYTVFSFPFPKIKHIKILFFGIAEMTSGIASAQGADFAKKFLFGAFVIGFGGASAIMQVMSICAKYELSCKKLLAVKTISAFLVPFAAFGLVFLMNVLAGEMNARNQTITVIAVIFAALLAFLLIFSKKCIKKYKKSKVNF